MMISFLAAPSALSPVVGANFVGQTVNGGNGWAAAADFSCVDQDSDGLCSRFEDGDGDGDGKPATNPGPDTDGDGLANYLDADDDDDALLTASENPDPNGDGDPADAVDSDFDGEPDYLDPATVATIGVVASQQTIADGTGGITGPLDDYEAFGAELASIGDVDGDGTIDLLAGVSGDDDGGNDRGAVFVLFLNPDGTVKGEQKINSVSGGLTGPLDDGDQFGTGVAGIGDLDTDGVPDIAVGARYDDDGGTNRGAVWVLFLNADGTVKGEQKISSTQGGLTGPLVDSNDFGDAVGSIGDVDGDGVQDLAVGQWRDASDRGAVYILFLNPDGTVKGEQKISSTQGGLTGPLDALDWFGFDVNGVGDLDSDGVPDLAVGAPQDDDGGSDRGATYVLFLNANGTVKSEQKISSTDGGFTGPLVDGDYFGVSVAGIGDLDLDGIGDLAVGNYLDNDGGTSRGAVYLLLMNANGTVKTEYKISSTQGGLPGPLADSDYFGEAVAPLGDLDDDGTIGLAVGASGDDTGGTSRGKIYMLDLQAL